MRGARPRLRASAACAMRSVCSTFSSVTASMASRSATWMLTSTVRNSSLASIMRTGIWASGAPACRAASACSSSVWPGQGTPAAASASLCSGAVTSAATSPASAARAAQTTQSAAARPASALTTPKGSGPGRPGSCHTGRLCGGTWRNSVHWPMRCTASRGRPGCSMQASARAMVAASPTTKAPASTCGASRKALATISGPMPAGSPWVMASGRPGGAGVSGIGTALCGTRGAARGRGGAVWQPRQAGLSMSMNWCSSPSSAATCAATAGAP